MRTRDETLPERLQAGAWTGGLMGGLAGLGGTALSAPKHFIEHGAEKEALLKFMIKHGKGTAGAMLGLAALTPLLSGALYAIHGPRKIGVEK